MPDDEALRRARRQKMAWRRLAEPGIERGDEEIRRGDEEIRRGDEEIRRGDEEIRRGALQREGGVNRLAADIFQRATDLGGHLIVAFVAPVSAPSRSRFRPVSGPSSPQAVAAAADAELAEIRVLLTQKRMQIAHASQARMAGAGDAAASAGQQEPWSATEKE
jgi:hypothetical protein